MTNRELPFKASWHFDFNHTIEEVWPYLTDTDRLNQAIGLPHVEYHHKEDPDGGSRRFASFRIKGMQFKWEEFSYEWVLFRKFSVQRSYTAGPMKEMDALWEFEKLEGNRCRVKQTVFFAPRNKFFSPIVKFQMQGDSRKSFLNAYRQIEHFLDQKDHSAFRPRSEDLSHVDQGPRQNFEEKLLEIGASRDLCDRLTRFVFESYQTDLIRIRPFLLARLWKVDRLELLKLFLKATEKGLFALSWDVLCPSCRGAKRRTESLRHLAGKAHCNTCNIRFDVHFDESVELSFTISPTIRKIEVGEYCVGGPQNTPHYLCQKRLSSGQQDSIRLSLSVGRYRIRSLQAKKTWNVDVKTSGETTPRQVQLQFKRSGDDSEESLVLKAGEIDFQIQNDFEREILFIVENTERGDDVCTAAFVTAIQEFRKRFSSEVLGPGQEIGLGAVALLFTDLKGSTAMYESIGDAPSFRLVQRHFDVLIGCVEKHEGGVVKTIGDAVMASFLKPENAVAAAIDMHREIAKSNADEEVKLRIKVGIHFGPCYVVNLNDKLDYFGGTVNVAARTEGQCSGGDIVISQTVMKDKNVGDLLQKTGLPIQKFDAKLKGFKEDAELYRIVCDPPSAQALRAVPRT